jgi:hypothetical protein
MRHRFPSQCAWSWLVLLVGLHATGTAGPWWDDYPRIRQGNELDAALAGSASVVFQGHLNAPSWGLYSQAVMNRSDGVIRYTEAGLKNITYFEAFGQAYAFVAELGPPGEEGVRPLLRSHWNWQQYGGGDIAWLGPHLYFDEDPRVAPYTRAHPVYGAPAMTYPDGREAKGYLGDAEDPRAHRVFDAGGAKDIFGGVAYTPMPVGDVAQKDGPHAGLLRAGEEWLGLLLMKKDAACPHWAGLDRAAARWAAEQGADGIWADNFGPWDSFGAPPVQSGFGEWSVARFRAYLAEHFTEDKRVAMGVGDLETFDVRGALRAQAEAWAGEAVDVDHKIWRDARWLDLPLWRAYLVFKRQTGTEALARWYDEVKAGAREGGQDNFLIAGNDIPVYSLGWPLGLPDMVSTEYAFGWGLDTGPRGIMLPPLGRNAPRYRLAREHAQSRLVNVWWYLEGERAEYRERPGLADVLFAEALANHALPMDYPGEERIVGPPSAYAKWFAFVKEAAPVWGKRKPIERVGIYYSSSSILARTTPGGTLDHAKQPHQFAVYGWGAALEQLHLPARPLPEWKLNAEELAGLDLLIIPNAECFNAAKVEKLLRPWVEAGGQLIVTGNSGMREGEEGNFDRRRESVFAAMLGEKEPALRAWYLPEDPGFAFYQATETRAELLSGVRAILSAPLAATAPPLLDVALPPSVGITLHEDRDAKRYFIDLYNLDIDLESDTIRPAERLAFSMDLPSWLDGGEARVLSPEGDEIDGIDLAGQKVTVNIGQLRDYACIVIEGKGN